MITIYNERVTLLYNDKAGRPRESLLAYATSAGVVEWRSARSNITISIGRLEEDEEGNQQLVIPLE